MKLFSNIEALIMVGSTRIFIQELIIKTGQYRSSRFKMETALVVSPQSHGMTDLTSAMTTHFSSISHAPASSPANIMVGKSTVLHIWVLASVQREEN